MKKGRLELYWFLICCKEAAGLFCALLTALLLLRDEQEFIQILLHPIQIFRNSSWEFLVKNSMWTQAECVNMK